MNYFKLIIVTIALSISFNVTAQKMNYNDGNTLLIACGEYGSTSPSNTITAGWSMGYCRGIVVGAELYANGDICFTPGISMRKLAANVVTYLEEHPDQLDMNAVGLAYWALIKQYPCDRENYESTGERKS
jgi:hypothetical protein